MTAALFDPLPLPGGAVLTNRIAKAAMSDSLGDGAGRPTPAHQRLYRRWAEGGAALSLIGEVQVDADHAENAGNLVLDADSDPEDFAALSSAGNGNGSSLWAQLGHAGALTAPALGVPRGPSALRAPGLSVEEMTLDQIQRVPGLFAASARRAQEAGFGGVEIHAAHGFLLSQFVSPLFNRRTDDYGGDPARRARLLREVIDAVRDAVGAAYPVGVKINATDGLVGGIDHEQALEVVGALDTTSLDLIDISGGTYFPGAEAVSERRTPGASFAGFALRARKRTGIPLMVTGGVKTLEHAQEVLASGAADAVGIARSLVLEPELPAHWRRGGSAHPDQPRFSETPEGGVTAWYTARIAYLAGIRSTPPPIDAVGALEELHSRDRAREERWHAARHAGAPERLATER